MKTCHVFFFPFLGPSAMSPLTTGGGGYKRTPSGGLLAEDGLNHGGGASRSSEGKPSGVMDSPGVLKSRRNEDKGTRKVSPGNRREGWIPPADIHPASPPPPVICSAARRSGTTPASGVPLQTRPYLAPNTGRHSRGVGWGGRTSQRRDGNHLPEFFPLPTRSSGRRLMAPSAAQMAAIALRPRFRDHNC